MKIDGGLRALFRRKLPEFHWQSVETGGTGRGVPDANYCHNGVEGWIEFKRTTGWMVPLREEQVVWISRRTRAGGRVWIAIRRKEAELWLVPGSMVQQLSRFGLTELGGKFYFWRGGPIAWNWLAIKSMLTGI